MKVKAKIILDLDNHYIESIQFKDQNLNLFPISVDLRREVHRKIARTGVARFTFVPNVSDNPIGMPFLCIDTTIEVFPKVYKDDDVKGDFKYKCVLKVAPVKNEELAYPAYLVMREKHLIKLSNKIKELQHD